VGAAITIAVILALLATGLLWVWPTMVANRIGSEKQRENPWLWGFALGWIGVLILVNAPSPRLVVITPFVEGPPTTKTCPRCAETVKRAANVCRFCGYRLNLDQAGPYSGA
jgi:hypothetical protein